MNHIEEGRFLLLKGKDKSLRNYFIEYLILLLALSVIGWGISIFVTKSFEWWEIPLDIALSIVIALFGAWVQVRWNRRREQENDYFSQKYGTKKTDSDKNVDN
jgi:membrane protein implicated in regulation of membrane protease activity